MAHSEPNAKVQQARRHVAQAEKRLAQQRERIERMTRDGDSSATLKSAESMLHTFEKTLDAMRQHLSIEESEDKESSN